MEAYIVGEIIDFVPERQLTEEQRDYWFGQLEIAQRQVQYAKRMLGILATENGLEG